MLGNIGPWEILLVLIVALLVFGPKRLPEMGKSMGRGMREFKDSLSGDRDDDDHSAVGSRAVSATQELPPAAPPPPAATMPAAAVPAATVPVAPPETIGTPRSDGTPR